MILSLTVRMTMGKTPFSATHTYFPASAVVTILSRYSGCLDSSAIKVV